MFNYRKPEENQEETQEDLVVNPGIQVTDEELTGQLSLVLYRERIKCAVERGTRNAPTSNLMPWELRSNYHANDHLQSDFKTYKDNFFSKVERATRTLQLLNGDNGADCDCIDRQATWHNQSNRVKSVFSRSEK